MFIAGWFYLLKLIHNSKMKYSKAGEFLSQIEHFTEDDFIALPITPLNELKHLALQEDQMKSKMELLVTRMQKVIISRLSEYDTATFKIDRWSRDQGGGGISAVLQDGSVFEKGGVNISVVYGNLSAGQVKHMRARGKDIGEGTNSFFATGISSVLHPVNPHVPTLHFNYRYFEVRETESGKHTWWFGGGSDLTPYYLVEDDVVNFHSVLKDACDEHDATYYPRFKKWADDYFYNVHQKEHRGVGGLFFDDLDEKSIDECFSFIVTCTQSILPSYLPMLDKHKDEDYTAVQRNWQLIRRGRYVEFNLIYDRGTKFGLATPGSRIESVLMSLPLTARWEYMAEVVEGSEEDKLTQVLRSAKDWLNIDSSDSSS